MIILLVLAAIILAPAALLVVKGPGEIELVTTPMNLGVVGENISTISRARIPAVESSASTPVNAVDWALSNHAMSLPANLLVWRQRR